LKDSSFHSPGHPVGFLKTLDDTALRQFDSLPAPDLPGIEAALEKLLFHLDEELIAVARAQLSEEGRCRLAVFGRQGQRSEAEYFIAVTGKGLVEVGTLPELKVNSRKRLADFDPLKEEVLSIAVTDRHRPLSALLDLYILVRTFAGQVEETCYHGVIQIKAGKPELELAGDEENGERPPSWMRRPASRLPAGLRHWRLTSPPAGDPFDLPDLAGAPEIGLGQAVAFTAEWLAFADFDRIGLWKFGSPTSSANRKPPGGEVTLLALAGGGRGKVRGIYALDSRQLAAFEHEGTNADAPLVFKQGFLEFPVDAVCLNQPEDGSWPDLLVAFRDGTLERLRWCGQARLREVWEKLLDRLGLGALEARLAAYASIVREAPARPLKARESWQQVLLFAAVEKLLTRLLQDDPAAAAKDADRLVSLFPAEVHHRLLVVGLFPLLQQVRALAERDDDPERLRLLIAAAATIHSNHDGANIELQVHIERALGSLDRRGLPPEAAVPETLWRQEKTRRTGLYGQLVSRPAPGPEELVARCALSLERWASSYVSAQTARFKFESTGQPRQPRQLALCTVGQAAAPPDHLALLMDHSFEIHPFEGSGVIDPNGGTRFPIDAGRGVGLEGLPNAGSDRILLITTAGAELLRLARSKKKPAGSQAVKAVRVRQIPWPERLQPPVRTASLTLPGGEKVVVVASSYQGGTRLQWLQVTASEVLEVETRWTDLHRIGCLDLARGPGGCLMVLTGSLLEGAVELHDWLPGQIFTRKKRYWPSGGGSLALRFDRQEDPRYCVIGDWSGYLWCADLHSEAIGGRLVWLYKLDTAVRALTRVAHAAGPAMLAASDAGKMILLRIADGARLWSHRMLSPVERLDTFVLEGHSFLAVLMRYRWLTIFEQVTDGGAARETAAADRRRLARRQLPPAIFNKPDAAIVEAFCELAEGRGSAAQWLGRLGGREQRARLLRWLAQPPPGENYDLGGLARELSLRELQLLLSYLPLENTSYDAEILHEIEEREPAPAPGDDSFRAAMAAMVASLERTGRRKPDPCQVIAVRPRRAAWYGVPWLRFELARIFMHALAREVKEQPSPALLVAALPYLLQFPPILLRSFKEVLKSDSADWFDFKMLHETVERLSEGTPLPLEQLSHLRLKLAALPPTDELHLLILRLLELNVAWCEARTDDDWREGRLEVLQAARELNEALNRIEESRPLAGGKMQLGEIAGALRRLLPREVLPGDESPQKERSAWLQAARAQLASARIGAPLAADDPWQAPVLSLLAALKKLLQKIVERESSHLVNEVKPFLALAEPLEAGATGKVVLRLRVTAEGRRQLEDVSLVVDAQLPSGLRGPGTLSQTQRLATFAEALPTRFFDLEGFVARGQDKIALRSRLETADDADRHFQLWEFALPARQRKADGEEAGAFLEARFIDRFTALPAGRQPFVEILVLDPGPERHAVVQRWLEQNRGLRIDLDEALEETGYSRRYSADGLTLAHVVQALAGPAAGGRARLVSPADATLSRLLAGESPGLLPALAVWLRAELQRTEGPRLVLVVSATHAAELRRFDLGNLPLTRLPLFEPSRLEIPATESEAKGNAGTALRAAELLRSTRNEVPAAVRVVEGLGGDPYLLLQWLHWLEAPSKEPALGGFLRRSLVRERILAELRALSSLDLIHVLLGAETETVIPLSQVLPGQYSSLIYRSTTQHQESKIVQAADLPFTERSLSALRSDRRPPPQIRLQGFGSGTTSEAPRTRLLPVAASRSRAQRQESFERLGRLGFGTYIGGIFRCREPYRTYIRTLYSQAAAGGADKRDGRVYEEILGPGRAPFEGVSLSELFRLSPGELASLLPRATAEEIKTFQRLGRLWEEGEGTAELAFHNLYRQQGLTKVPPEESRWDLPLARLSPPPFGVGRSAVEEKPGRIYPGGYHFWLPPGTDFDPEVLKLAIEETIQRRRRRELEEAGGEDHGHADSFGWTPRIVLIGPGAAALQPDESRRYAVLKEVDLCQAIWEGDFSEELLRRARGQMRLTAISPFQTSGPIAPGSRYFFGREKEMEFIQATLRRASILVVGSRRVGKTSLLNQVRHWARSQPDLEPIYIDLQRVGDEKKFKRALRAQMTSLDHSDEVKNWAASRPKFELEDLVEAVGGWRRLPVFFFNEIDGLARVEAVVGEWRRLNEQGKARFVMAAYSAVAELGAPESPFFHFTEGLSFGGRAIAPTALSPTAAENLLALLTGSELGLKWTSAEDRAAAHEQLIERSYRIPWVLQYYCRLLLQRLEVERRATLGLDDVAFMLRDEGDVVWRYIDQIQYETLGSTTTEAARRPGLLLVLYCLARQRYFLGGRAAPIRDERLAEREPLAPELGFTVDEAREVVKNTVASLLVGREKIDVLSWFDRLELDRALRLLTLTLTIEPDPAQAARYAFLRNILPRELQRKYGSKDPTLDLLIVDTAVRLLRFLSNP
jgi:hypothetical protein